MLLGSGMGLMVDSNFGREERAEAGFWGEEVQPRWNLYGGRGE